MTISKSINFNSYYNTTQSLKSRIVYFVIKISGIKSLMARQTKSDLLRKGSRPLPPKKVPDNIHIECRNIKGNNVFTIQHKANPAAKYILYLHGGAYVISFASVHWKFMFKLVEETRCTIIAPDYPLSPEYSYKERFAMVMPLYKDLIKTMNSKNIIIMGDSSGGNFSLSLAQKIKFDNLPTPGQVILLSPWLDVSMENPEIYKIDKKDPLLPANASDVISKAHAGDLDLKNFMISPLFGSLDGIGRISLFTGTNDVLNPDAKKLKSKAEAEGIDFHYYEYKNMIHVWMLFPMPEARMARAQIVELIGEK